MFGLCDPLDPPCHCPIRASYQYLCLLFHYPLPPSSSVDVINGSPLTAPSMEGVTSGNNFWGGKRRRKEAVPYTRSFTFASSFVADTNRTFLLFLLDRRTRTERSSIAHLLRTWLIKEHMSAECGRERTRTRGADVGVGTSAWLRCSAWPPNPFC